MHAWPQFLWRNRQTDLDYIYGPGYITAGRNIDFSYGLSIFGSASKTESPATFCRPPAHQKNEARWPRRTHFHPPRPQANLASSAAQIQQLGSNQIVQPKNHSTGGKKKIDAIAKVCTHKNPLYFPTVWRHDLGFPTRSTQPSFVQCFTYTCTYAWSSLSYTTSMTAHKIFTLPALST